MHCVKVIRGKGNSICETDIDKREDICLTTSVAIGRVGGDNVASAKSPKNDA